MSGVQRDFIFCIGGINMELSSYEVNMDTLVIVPVGKNRSKVYENGDVFIVKKSCRKIIEDSCLFFGCSYEGRKEGIKSLLNIDMKIPIVIEDTRNIIFFPISSCIREDSVWISYQNLIKYAKYNDISTTLYFKDSIKINVGCKYCLIDNQVIRCIKLEKLLLNRKKFMENSFFKLKDC